MINLLPTEYKQEIRAGRGNVILVRYIMILITAVIVLSGLLIGAYIVLNNTRSIAEAKVAENEQRTVAYQPVRTQADAFRGDLTTAQMILANDVSFTELIYEIAAIVPPNVVLDDLSLDPKNFGSNATMNASAKTFEDAAKLKDAFIRSNQIFSNVQLQTIRDSETGASTTKYPVKVNLSVVINKGALQ